MISVKSYGVKVLRWHLFNLKSSDLFQLWNMALIGSCSSRHPSMSCSDCSPGVMYLRDPRSLVFNFDPYLEKIMPMEEFDYDALYEYITSSRDTTLVEMAKEHGASFVGSTSSMTTVLSHFHFLISAWRPVNIDMLSTVYANIGLRSFTVVTRAPAGIFLRYKGDGIYAIDADKMFDDTDTVLSWLVIPPPPLVSTF